MSIPYGRQNVNEHDINAVISVLKSDYLTQGPAVMKFEEEISAYTGSKYAVAVNSATSALHIACLALGVGPGDCVWTSPITFVASANCALYCGADIDFVDINLNTYNMSVDALKEKLEHANLNNNLPKVVIPVHMGGQSCDMKEIHSLSLRYGFKVIEDASHAIGAKYMNTPVGGCVYSDITVFSFHPVKIITTGEGGMATTNNAELSNTMNRLRSHGVTRDPFEMDSLPDGPWYYQQIDLGFNYRITDFQAALGSSQLKRLDEFVKQRHILSENYKKLLSGLPVKLPYDDPNCHSSYHLYIIKIPYNNAHFNRDIVFERLRLNGILANIHYIPLYRQPYYSKFNFDHSLFPNSEKYYSEAISIPMFPDLTKREQSFVVDTLSNPKGYQTLF